MVKKRKKNSTKSKSEDTKKSKNDKEAQGE